MKWIIRILCIIASLQTVMAQNAVLDIKYATVENTDLLLDLYMPTNVANPYLVLWIHGGAWAGGSKSNPPMDLLKKGYALASVEYRNTTQAKYPAYLHDVKASVRYLRAHADKFKFHDDKIFIWGSSAGGHIVSLVGLTNDMKDMEGTVGDHLDISSSVQGIIDFYGPTNLSTIMKQSTPHGVSVRGPALEKMFNKKLDSLNDELVMASPINYVTANDPPLFICHGDQDNQVPINQSIELYGKYKSAGLKVQLEFAYGAGHGGKQYNDPGLIGKMDEFLKGIIGGK